MAVTGAGARADVPAGVTHGNHSEARPPCLDCSDRCEASLATRHGRGFIIFQASVWLI